MVVKGQKVPERVILGMDEWLKNRLYFCMWASDVYSRLSDYGISYKRAQHIAEALLQRWKRRGLIRYDRGRQGWVGA